jgi:hypothetical protein
VKENDRVAELNPVFVPAFQAVLRPGIMLMVPGPIGACADGEWLNTPLQMRGGGDDLHFNAFGFWQTERAAKCRLDLRDPSVRDAVVRAIWRKLRSDEPEPLTTPRWSRLCYQRNETPDSLDSWTLTSPKSPPIDFSAASSPWGFRSEWRTVVDLGDSELVPLDSPNRDLLALAEVAKAVLS